MPQYHSARPGRRSRKKSLLDTKGLWLCIGLGIGLITALMLYHRPAIKHRLTTKQNVIHPKKTRPLAANHQIPEGFEFYQLLPGLEVPLDPPAPSQAHAQHRNLRGPTVDRQSTRERPSTPTRPPVTYKVAATRYLIQVGNFRQRTQAEKLGHSLRHLGFEPRNQMVEAEDGIWFRVTLGPFADEGRALQQKKRLQQQQIHGILILQRS